MRISIEQATSYGARIGLGLILLLALLLGFVAGTELGFHFGGLSFGNGLIASPEGSDAGRDHFAGAVQQIPDRSAPAFEQHLSIVHPAAHDRIGIRESAVEAKRFEHAEVFALGSSSHLELIADHDRDLALGIAQEHLSRLDFEGLALPLSRLEIGKEHPTSTPTPCLGRSFRMVVVPRHSLAIRCVGQRFEIISAIRASGRLLEQSWHGEILTPASLSNPPTTATCEAKL